MDWVYLVVYALIAGGLVTLASGFSRRLGLWGGIVAAAPVTPTFAVLLLHQAQRAPDLAAGLPSIVATLVVLSLATVGLGPLRAMRTLRPGLRFLPRLPSALLIVLFVPPLAWTLSGWTPNEVLFGLLVLAALFAGYRLRFVDPHLHHAGVKSAKKAAWWRFLLGASGVFLVAAAVRWLPGLASYFALFPLVFTAGLWLAEMDGGKNQAVRIMAGGVPGSMGVAAFAGVVSWLLFSGVSSVLWLLAAGWIGYALTSAVWLGGTLFLQGVFSRRRGTESARGSEGERRLWSDTAARRVSRLLIAENGVHLPYAETPQGGPMHAVEVAMSQTPGAWCHRVTTRWPGLHFQVDAMVTLADDRMLEVVTLQGSGVSEAVGQIRQHLGEGNVQLLDEGPERVQVRLESKSCPLMRLMANAGLVPRFPVPLESGWDHWLIVDQKKALGETLHMLRADSSNGHGDGLKAKVIRSGPLRASAPLLTPHQRRILEAAIDAGYYDKPRTTTIRGLATELGVSKSTVSETLLTIENKVIRSYISRGNDPAVQAVSAQS